jgi:hypothetical protein
MSGLKNLMKTYYKKMTKTMKGWKHELVDNLDYHNL